MIVLLLDCTLASLLVLGTAGATPPSPLDRVQALGLETTQVGRVTAHFAAADREHAHALATLSEAAAGFYARELGGSFPLSLAVLAPEQWFDPYPGGEFMPYGMPWGWVEDSLMTGPASLSQGVLIVGPDQDANLRRVRFVLLHEFGHLAGKRYLHPASSHPYSSVRWFEELVATYFAYAFVHAHDPAWAKASRGERAAFVAGSQPSVVSLDWSFMRELAPEEFGWTYAWYQNLLNLRAAELHEEHGLAFLIRLRDELPWETSDEWTTETLMPHLERVAPGFRAWADGLAEASSSHPVPE